MENYIVFDVETNGLGTFRPPTQEVTQLAFIKFNKSGKNLHEYSSIISGATEINDKIESVKISLEDIKTKGIDIKIALNEFLNAIDENTKLYAHNAMFDISIIKRECLKYKLNLPKNKIVCTMKSSTNYCKLKNEYGNKWPSLSELATKLNIRIDESKFHDALYDCDITKKCVLKGIQEQIF